MILIWPNFAFRFRLMEEISGKVRTKEINSILTNLNFGILLMGIFMFVNLISVLIAIRLQAVDMRCKRKYIEGKRNFLHDLFVSKWNRRLLSALSVFLLFYNMHLWFVGLMIQNNIKTNKVLVVLI